MDKQAIRTAVWDRLEAEGLARFPFPPHGRIPNFEGAAAAADRLTAMPWWTSVTTIKCNPDAPQRPVREAALRDGKAVVMAQPRLRSDRPFLRIDPDDVDDPAAASTIGGANDHGTPVTPEEVPDVDAIVAGSVAVDRHGRRIGKGEGYSDLEFAILVELDVLGRDVTVATTVHDIQVWEDRLPDDDHDVSLDAISTPTTTIRVSDRPPRPAGLDWTRLDEEQRDSIPILKRLDNSR